MRHAHCCPRTFFVQHLQDARQKWRSVPQRTFCNWCARGTSPGVAGIYFDNLLKKQVGFEDDFFEEINLPGKFYRSALIESALKQALENVPFKPDLVFIFSGYDGHINDCGDGITNYTNSNFEEMTRMVLDYTKKDSLSVISLHGGGYADPLSITINAALAHVEVLANY